MHKIDGAGHVNNTFVQEDAFNNIPPTLITDDWLNAVQEEIANVVEGAGGVLDKADNTQLLQAIMNIRKNSETPPQFDNDTSTATTAFVKTSGYTYAKMVAFTSGPQTLNASHCGQLIDLTSAYTGDLTLPPATGLVDGAVIHIWSGSSSSINVKRNGTDVIYVNSSTVNTVVVAPGETLILARFGTSSWVAIGGSAQLKYGAGFAATLADNGWQRLPSGLVVQLGRAANVTAGPITVTLPITYLSTKIFEIAVPIVASPTGWDVATSNGGASLSQSIFNRRNGNGTTTNNAANFDIYYISAGF